MNDRPRSRWLDRLATRLATSVVALSLLTTSALAEAAPGLETQAKQLPTSAKKGYGAGKQAFDSGDFARAGDEWAAVLGGMEESAQTQGPRMRLILDAIASYRAAYAKDGNIAHLEAGMDTYYAYFKAYKDAYGTPAIPRPVVEARHALKDDLDRAKAQAPAASPGGEPPNPPPAAPEDPQDPPQDPSPTTHTAQDPSAPAGGSGANGSNAGTSISVSTQSGSTDKTGTPLIAAGAVIAAAGVGASSLIIVGALGGKQARADQKAPGYDDAQRDRIDKQGRTMNAMLIAGAVIAPILVGTGVALIVVGAKRRRQSALQATVSPLLQRGVAGIAVQGKF